jgi:DNA repair protein RadC
VQKISQLTEIPETEIEKAGVKFTMEHPQAVAKTKAQRWKLELLGHFFREYSEAEFVQEDVFLNTSSKAGNYFVTRLAGLKSKERLEIAFLDSSNKIIATKTLSEGTINEAPAYPREIIKEALDHDAANIVLAHNHPGDTLQPSMADIELTHKIKGVLQPLSIGLVDHIIVAGNTYTSFAEKGIMPA